jgi:uncharacterized iron-regulated protein
MITPNVRLAALAVVAVIALQSAAAAQTGEVSEVCRTSAHQAGGADSAAPDICAVIETASADGKPRIVDLRAAVDELAAAADQADFVLLGEIHDNPSHHRIRGQLILAMAARRAKAKRAPPGLVLEHIRSDQALAIAGFRAVDKVQRRTVDDFFKALGWQTSGWPDEKIFRPMLAAALDVEWPLVHGNLTREAMRSVAKGAVSAHDASEVKRLGLDVGLDDASQNDLLDQLVESHCRLMPREALTTMADAQRYRDAYMAAQLIDAAKTYDGAVLLAGNGHVRADRGVPWHLRRMAPGKRSLVVTFAQANRDGTDALTYVERGPNEKPISDYAVVTPRIEKPIADYVVVTPRVERPDPCEVMKKRFQAHPKGEAPKKE